MQEHVLRSQIFPPRMLCLCIIPSPKHLSSLLDDFQQAGSSLVIEAVALVTGGRICSGAHSENELIQTYLIKT